MNEEGALECSEHWYRVVSPGDSSLRQGDIFRNIAVYWLDFETPVPGDPEAPPPDPEYKSQRGDYIVLTSSCDLHQNRTPNVLLAEIRELTPRSLDARASEKVYKERAEVMRRGYDPGKFLLAPYAEVDPPFPFSWVALRNQVSLPIKYLRRWCDDDRLRLQSPIRELFGNKVGALLSAVGPEDETQIPSFKDGVYAAHILRSTHFSDGE